MSKNPFDPKPAGRLAAPLALAAMAMLAGGIAAAADEALPHVSLTMRNVQLTEVMEMLSRQNRINILVADEVEATVSFSLYDVQFDQALRSIVGAAGYALEERDGVFFVVKPENAGKASAGGFTVVRTFRLNYADPADLEAKLAPYLSSFGKLTALPKRRMLMVEDQAGYVDRMAAMLADLDRRPRQVMIEARVLEVTLTDEDSYGIDWSAFFSADGGTGTGSGGVQNLLSAGAAGSTGFFFDYLESDYQVKLRALEADGRVRNLASPKLVTTEDKEAEVIIGDRRGYRVTTTINQVTTESIEFLESGVILRVTPTIDADGRILLEIHPEVSLGTVDDKGLPSQTTTEVTTQLLVNSGESIFIGGLIRSSATEDRQGLPVLGRVPGVRWLFSNRSRNTTNVETIVVITPRLVGPEFREFNDQQVRRVEQADQELTLRRAIVERHVEQTFPARSAGQK